MSPEGEEAISDFDCLGMSGILLNVEPMAFQETVRNSKKEAFSIFGYKFEIRKGQLVRAPGGVLKIKKYNLVTLL